MDAISSNEILPSSSPAFSPGFGGGSRGGDTARGSCEGFALASSEADGGAGMGAVFGGSGGNGKDNGLTWCWDGGCGVTEGRRRAGSIFAFFGRNLLRSFCATGLASSSLSSSDSSLDNKSSFFFRLLVSSCSTWACGGMANSGTRTIGPNGGGRFILFIRCSTCV